MTDTIRRRGAVLLAGMLLVYSVLNGVTQGRSLCQSFGCQAIQSNVLWWLGAFYAAVLLWGAVRRNRHLAWIVVLGALVESGLVLTQVLLGLYCMACLAYTGFFVLFVFLDPGIPKLSKKCIIGIGGFTAGTAAVVSILLISACACSDSPYSMLDPTSSEMSLVFEPACAHCHSVLALLKELDPAKRVRLCPEAWSLRSVWRLLEEHCTQCFRWKDRIRCLVGTLAVVRANNTYCLSRGYRRVPLLFYQGQVFQGSELLSELRAFLDRSSGGLFGTVPDLFPEDGGACTIDACD